MSKVQSAYFTAEVRVQPVDGGTEQILFDILDELEGLEGVFDPDLTAVLSEGKAIFEFSFVPSAVATFPDEVSAAAMAALRAAIHAAGVATPQWPVLIESVSTRRGELVEA